MGFKTPQETQRGQEGGSRKTDRYKWSKGDMGPENKWSKING